MDRSKLQYRKNCEGYFFHEGKVVARDIGFIEFPGGGVDEDSEEEALKREVLEETGCNVSNLKKKNRED